MLRVFLPSVFFILISLTSAQNKTCIDPVSDRVAFEIVGVKGPEGPAGPVGPKGDRGDKGDVGLRGVQGLKGEKGNLGKRGRAGLQGVAGLPGPIGETGLTGLRGYPGPEGPRGAPGLPGNTVLSEEEFERVNNELISSSLQPLLQKIEDLENTLQLYKKCNQTTIGITSPARSCKEIFAAEPTSVAGYYLISQNGWDPVLTYCKNHLCGLTGPWRRVAHINMSEEGAQCPPGLQESSDPSGNIRACGRTVDRNCSSVHFPTGSSSYTQICGIVRGYAKGAPNAFGPSYNYPQLANIDSSYVDGISITRGSPREHIWTYAARLDEIEGEFCSCANFSYLKTDVPSFVGNDYYCESGHIGPHSDGSYTSRPTSWTDPLWDGEGCTIPENRCCDRHGWFHKNVSSTTDDVEVKWCSNNLRTDKDVLTDLVDIWVL